MRKFFNFCAPFQLFEQAKRKNKNDRTIYAKTLAYKKNVAVPLDCPSPNNDNIT